METRDKNEDNDDLPSSDSTFVCVSYPTADELRTISMNTAVSWQDSLSLSAYVEESQYMSTVPLARNGGMTSWILVDSRYPPGKRHILSSCETFRKRALVSDARGHISEAIVHGIASVFCSRKYRGHGFPKRMMKELAGRLSQWQAIDNPCFGSILYSDIGRDYYAKLGWRPDVSNSHIELQPQSRAKHDTIRHVHMDDLPALCERDEKLVRERLSVGDPAGKSRMSIVPDIDHMLWHLAKEEFACKHIFGKIPQAKGAIAGPRGSQVWALWTHRYYDHPSVENTENVLHILRLVMEKDESSAGLPSNGHDELPNENHDHQMSYLKVVLQAAQAETAEWKLDMVKLWNPSPLVRTMLTRIHNHTVVEREKDSIASAMWYDQEGAMSEDPPVWVNNEYYAWC
ncbi:hypothetical protein EK21DRAFT_68614 [Setomelanomma holmii]|uniref:LYC1 C-terminal domain-containing protein n=1 Tax=Setomelanomma holmii TaxID=210430 RepID=A0A9P4LJA5_9PLEO|nr:hypothetical protein EK21DRAFT_68614 [Setomelanomma holmii]